VALNDNSYIPKTIRLYGYPKNHSETEWIISQLKQTWNCITVCRGFEVKNTVISQGNWPVCFSVSFMCNSG